MRKNLICVTLYLKGVENVCGKKENKNKNCEKLLCNKIDYKQKFNTNIDDICTKVGQNLNALSRKVLYMEPPEGG